MIQKYNEVYRERIDIIRRCSVCGEILISGDRVLRWTESETRLSPLGKPKFFKTTFFAHPKHEGEK